MAKLLVVSRTMALAMRLAEAHEVIEHPVVDLEQIAPTPETDVAVLDVADPVVAASTLHRWRSTGHTVPVLVVSGYQPGWNTFSSAGLHQVLVIPLPITRAALLHGIRVLTAEPSATQPPLDPGASDHAPVPKPSSDPNPDGSFTT